MVIGWYNKLVNKEWELKRQRMKFCKKCKHKGKYTCKICHCVLDAKLRVKDAKCPINKW